MIDTKPYKDNHISGDISQWTREFDCQCDSHEFIWHRDKKDRDILVLDGDAWFFQMDEEIPHELKKGDVLHIANETYHRIFKAGTNTLKIQITES